MYLHFTPHTGQISSSTAVSVRLMYPSSVCLGRIAVGSDADIVVWNPKETQTVSAKTHNLVIHWFFTISNQNTFIINWSSSYSPCSWSECRRWRWTSWRVWSFEVWLQWWSVVVELFWRTENSTWLKVQGALSPGRLSPMLSTRGSEPAAR